MDGVDEPGSPTPPTGHQHQSGHLMCYEGRTSSRALDSYELRFVATATCACDPAPLSGGSSDPEGRALFTDTMSTAIEGARTLTRLDHLSKAIWQALAAGAVGDDDAQSLAERLHARRSLLRGDLKPAGIPAGRPSIFPPRRLQKAPKRPVAIARRRHLAASGPMPPALACKFTVSELAVLRIIGDEVRQHGQCDRCVDELAARAGVCRRMVQTAVREAARLGLLTIEERRREGRRNLPNVIRIISKEWMSWLSRGRRSSHPPAERPIGCKTMHPTDRSYKNQRSRRSEPTFAARRQQAGSAAHNEKRPRHG